MTVRYLLDGRGLEGPSAVRGIGTYIRGLLHGFHQLGIADDVRLLMNNGAVLSPETARDGFHPYARGIPRAGRRLQLLADPILLQALLKLAPPTLYHAVEWGQPLHADVPVVVTVHDLIPFVRADLFGWHRALLRLPALQLLHKADALVVDSGATAEDVRRLTKVPDARIHVVHLAASDHFVPVSVETMEGVVPALGVRRPFLLAVGTFEPRKRLGALLEVVRLVRRAVEIDLVIVGSHGVFTEAVHHSVASAGLTSCTTLLAKLTGSQLAALYTASECLVFTSAYEGFGLPPLEAMACGTPVVAFRNSSIPEVVGEAAILVADNDVIAMAEATIGVINAPAERERLRGAGLQRASMFSWLRTAAETLAVYQSLVGGSSS